MGTVKRTAKRGNKARALRELYRLYLDAIRAEACEDRHTMPYDPTTIGKTVIALGCLTHTRDGRFLNLAQFKDKVENCLENMEVEDE